MKKCKICCHSGFTERGEQVCAKYLLYVGEDDFEKPCNGFEMQIRTRHIAVSAIVIILMGVILMCTL